MSPARIFLLLSLPLASISASYPSADDDPEVLKVAKRVASEEFKGFHYGSQAPDKEVDCVQFLGVVIERLLDRPLTKSEKDSVYINYTFKDLAAAVQNEDERTRGVQIALCKVIGEGTRVELMDVRVGDFIQYWIKKKDGTWMGHAAIIAKIIRNEKNDIRVAIYGSHKSTNGITVADFGGSGLQLISPDRKVFSVLRPNTATPGT